MGGCGWEMGIEWGKERSGAQRLGWYGIWDWIGNMQPRYAPLPSPDSENNDAWLQVAAIPNRDLVRPKFNEEQNLSYELHSDRHY